MLKKSPAQPALETTNAAAPDQGNAIFSERNMKLVFFISVGLMLLITLFSGYNVGYHQDEIDMNLYGKANAAFYTSGGKDTTYLGRPTGFYSFDSLLRYYGCGFEYLAIGANKVCGTSDSKQEFNVRHSVNQILGVLAIMFTGLIARRLMGWRAALLAAWLAFFSPSFSGQILFNTKDIPFCLGYVASLYYIICFLEELPNITWKTTIKLMFALAFAIDIRIGGVILIVFAGLFNVIYLVTDSSLRKLVWQNRLKLSIKYAVVILGSFVLVTLSWPYLLSNPIPNLLRALTVIQKYPMRISINFSGETIDSLSLPNEYIPKLMLLTAPIGVLLFLAVGLIYCVRKYKFVNLKIIGLLLFASIFPVVYALAKNATLYTGWRHFLFIYPSICIIAALGILTVYQLASKLPYKIAIVSLCALLFIKPVIWSVKNHPYEYCYFNELSGGFNKAYYNYDNDYWQISMKNAMDWLMQKEQVAQSKDTVTIATNIPRILEYYLTIQYPEAVHKIKFVNVGCTSRNLDNWKYAVFNNFMLKPLYLENWFPPRTTCYSEKIDGLPVTVVLKDTNRYDLKAINAVSLGNFKAADSLYAVFTATTHDNNPALDGNLALAKAFLNQNDSAIAYANRALEYRFSDGVNYNSYCALGIAYANKQQFTQSMEALKEAANIFPGDQLCNDIMKQVVSISQAKH